ncbi:MAG: hypothetical protein MI919_19845 [Holophagales bacterium]|nr:hypothetical protein [Holophagales bacterium]
MKTIPGHFTVLCLVLVLASASKATASQPSGQDGTQAETELEERAESRTEGPVLRAHYLEIVTPSVDETCDALEKAHGVTFGERVAELGNARTARLEGGGRIGVRAPMRVTEEPVVRPYLLVEDIDAAVRAAEDAGAQVALPPTEIPGHGTFAVYLLGGIEHGLWQIRMTDSESR